MRRFFLLLMCVSAAGPVGRPLPPNSGVFELEVPELDAHMKENESVRLATSLVTRLVLHVLRGPDEVPYGSIHVRINGVAANIILTVRSNGPEITGDLDLQYRPGFLLHAGRNSVEAWAESVFGRYWYASFLLDVFDEPETLREIRVESHEGTSRHAPIVQLLNPDGPVTSSERIEVRGNVLSVGGNLDLSLNGMPLSLGAPIPAGARGMILEKQGERRGFHGTAVLSPGETLIELKAQDSSGGWTRLEIPVVERIQESGDRYALIVGVSHYRDPRLTLQFADSDAIAVRDFLLSPKGAGLNPANVRFLLNEEATAANIRTGITTFLERANSGDLVYVYFAGHGAPDPRRPNNLYLLSYDTDLKNMGGTAVPMWELEAAFEQTIHGNVLSFVDACHSAGIGNIPNLTNQVWTKAAYGQHRAVITASNTGEFSQESPQWGGGHGVFTYFLLQGLDGAADANRDGRVTVGELFDYVRAEVRQVTDGEQTPTALAGFERGLVVAERNRQGVLDRGRETRVNWEVTDALVQDLRTRLLGNMFDKQAGRGVGWR